MRTNTQKGFGTTEIILAILVMVLLGLSAWFIYHRGDKANSVQPASRESSVDPYAGWKTYTSPHEGLSLRYPTDWKLKPIDSSAEDADAVQISFGEVGVFWDSSVDNYDRACDATWTPSTPKDIDPALKPCPYYYVIHKQKLDKLDAYFVAGVSQSGYEDPHFATWCALQPTDGVLTDQSVTYLPLIPTKNNADGARLNCIDPLVYATKQAALDRLNSVYSRIERIKLIMVSATY